MPSCSRCCKPANPSSSHRNSTTALSHWSRRELSCEHRKHKPERSSLTFGVFRRSWPPATSSHSDSADSSSADIRPPRASRGALEPGDPATTGFEAALALETLTPSAPTMSASSARARQTAAIWRRKWSAASCRGRTAWALRSSLSDGPALAGASAASALGVVSAAAPAAASSSPCIRRSSCSSLSPTSLIICTRSSSSFWPSDPERTRANSLTSSSSLASTSEKRARSNSPSSAMPLFSPSARASSTSTADNFARNSSTVAHSGAKWLLACACAARCSLWSSATRVSKSCKRAQAIGTNSQLAFSTASTRCSRTAVCSHASTARDCVMSRRCAKAAHCSCARSDRSSTKTPCMSSSCAVLCASTAERMVCSRASKP
mmetsp:Transcript_40234/g.115629  ORF Transcript_40234/g.115629 Transcript_40234/m.115629 type:complete len:377 (+) Transcript_40234:388-1518(+)